MTDLNKVQRIGRAVTQLADELINSGQQVQAERIVDAFAKLPIESMERFHDIVMTSETKSDALDQLHEERA